MSETEEQEQQSNLQVRGFYEAQLKFPQFNDYHFQGFATAFRKFDTDGSGTIDAKELQNCLKAMGEGATPDQVGKLLKRVDADGSGELDFVEYCSLMNLLYPQEAAKFHRMFIVPAEDFLEFSKDDINVFVEAFRNFDADDSGAISEFELVKCLNSMGQGATKEQVKKLLERVDTDGSGELDFGEFLALMSLLYPNKKAHFEATYMVPASKYYIFTRLDILSFLKSFRRYDVDGSDSIDCAELKDILLYMGEAADPKRVTSLVEKFDADGSGEIEFPEFLAMMDELYKARYPQVAKKYLAPATSVSQFKEDDVKAILGVFRLFDEDSSDSIDPRELARMLKYMGQGASLEQVSSLIHTFDSDKSGSIEWLEFLKLMATFYGAKPTPKTSTPAVSKPVTSAPSKPAPVTTPSKPAPVTTTSSPKPSTPSSNATPSYVVGRVSTSVNTDAKATDLKNLPQQTLSKNVGSTPDYLTGRVSTSVNSGSNAYDPKKVVGVAPVLDANFVAPKSYPYEVLTKRPLPDDVNANHIEAYLNDEEYKKYIGVSRQEFNAQPAWKRVEAKKKLQLH